ncbi:MAG TPA: segregation/condensation protein A [Lachnospiraceae bacterium]|nr:segregation/condensation protein A [Lachnospiraceae bacterium]
MDLNFKLQQFEGPLDLLLHLIDKNKMDIFDIPIVEITAQYMEYIRAMKEANLDVMSEFLVMAATLLKIKSKMLLPIEETEDEEEEDPRAELVKQLLEYKMYKCISYELRDRQVDANNVYFKVPTIPDEVSKYEQPVDLDELMSDITLSKLNAIFNSVIKRQENRVDPVRSKFGKIEKEEVSLEDKMNYMLEFARHNRNFSFRQLLEGQRSKMDTIVTFLVILEMMKAGQIFIVQENTFDDIKIESKMVA